MIYLDKKIEGTFFENFFIFIFLNFKILSILKLNRLQINSEKEKIMYEQITTKNNDSIVPDSLKRKPLTRIINVIGSGDKK